MIKFFRKIRQKLLVENKIGRYFKYAIGEIVLVVIGILIALQVNNWNEKRKAEITFKTTIEQIYNALENDYNNFSKLQGNIEYQVKLIDSLIDSPLDLDTKLLPFILFYSELQPTVDFDSELKFYLNNLEFDTNNKEQLTLSKDVSSYALQDKSTVFYNYKQNFISPFIKNLELPNPILVFGYSALNNFEENELSFFNEEQRRKALDLIQTKPFKSALLTANRQKELSLIFMSDYMQEVLYWSYYIYSDTILRLFN